MLPPGPRLMLLAPLGNAFAVVPIDQRRLFDEN